MHAGPCHFSRESCGEIKTESVVYRYYRCHVGINGHRCNAELELVFDPETLEPMPDNQYIQIINDIKRKYNE